MKANFLKVIKNSVKYWYLPLIAGIIFIGVGIQVFRTPVESYVALSLIFSISFLISGLMDAIFSIANREELEGWGWSLALGVLNILVGVMLLAHPQISIITLPFFVGLVVFVRSIMAIGVSLDLKNYYVMDWGYLLAIGVVGIIFSFLLLVNPSFAGMTLVATTGIAFIVLGIYNIFLSLKLKKLHDIPKKISNALAERLQSTRDEIHEQIIKEME